MKNLNIKKIRKTSNAYNRKRFKKSVIRTIELINLGIKNSAKSGINYREFSNDHLWFKVAVRYFRLHNKEFKTKIRIDEDGNRCFFKVKW